MKIITIVGARPQFIKSALLTSELKKYFEIKVIHTGQHYDYQLSNVFFEDLNISHPDYNLNVGSGSQGEQTARMLIEIEKVLLAENPKYVLVYGDTNSTIAAALAAKKLGIGVIHIEAGMRNYDEFKPEEINRILTDHISNFLFASTLNAIENLQKEGITDNVFHTGDVNCDIVLNFLPKAKKNNFCKKYGIQKKDYYLFTLHKSKNTDDPVRLKRILEDISKLSRKVLFPAHPRALKEIENNNLKNLLLKKKLIVTEPLGFLEFINALNNSYMVITDSGGVQKDAYVLGIPCITYRKTEWTETLETGWNVEVNILKSNIRDVAKNYVIPNKKPELFGNGKAYKNITNILTNNLQNKISG